MWLSCTIWPDWLSCIWIQTNSHISMISAVIILNRSIGREIHGIVMQHCLGWARKTCLLKRRWLVRRHRVCMGWKLLKWVYRTYHTIHNFNLIPHAIETQHSCVFSLMNDQIIRANKFMRICLYGQRRRLLTHLPLVPHICLSESGQHWFR